MRPSSHSLSLSNTHTSSLSLSTLVSIFKLFYITKSCDNRERVRVCSVLNLSPAMMDFSTQSVFFIVSGTSTRTTSTWTPSSWFATSATPPRNTCCPRWSRSALNTSGGISIPEMRVGPMNLPSSSMNRFLWTKAYRFELLTSFNDIKFWWKTRTIHTSM